jgi:hypothetical protein
MISHRARHCKNRAPRERRALAPRERRPPLADGRLA